MVTFLHEVDPIAVYSLKYVQLFTIHEVSFIRNSFAYF